MVLEEIIIAKFGGSSVATANDIRNVADIVLSDPRRTRIVLSAPGKGEGYSWKVTDKLRELVKYYHETDVIDQKLVRKVSERYVKLTEDLGLFEGEFGDKAKRVTRGLSKAIIRRLKEIYSNNSNLDQAMRLDATMPLGELYVSKIFSLYLRSTGREATIICPGDLKLVVTEDYGGARVLSESFEKIRNKLDNLERLYPGKIAIIPGYYGETKTKKVATLGRGGSDTTGGIVAAAIKKSYKKVIYENWTDTPGIRRVDPSIIPEAAIISHMTYREAKELTAMGFGVLEKSTLDPCERELVEIHVKNSKDPGASGTKIMKRCKPELAITGVAHVPNYRAMVFKFLPDARGTSDFDPKLYPLMVRNASESYLLTKGIPIEALTDGRNGFSLYVHESELRGKESDIQDLYSLLQSRFHLSDKAFDQAYNCSLITVVGEGLEGTRGIAAKILEQVTKAGANIRVINQFDEELSIRIGIREDSPAGENGLIAKKVVRQIYNTLIKPELTKVA